ncbi:MAG: signal peptidase I [Nitrospirae bacterium CG_4_10_14_3_um_filter_44_29]|nr:signal peptidase I [Nitrospirota bacterium]OIO28096.1 MAG: signal peptidase I [Nitrospirae bacterium CG1_02_44_142]PIP69524.1 MAG: signal peptidase I [Nitrospirae bacterium CG22_combo_CG10-13_8_21_14_all_44_11]PIV42866.1 MAG: signal peptidase I [Nitrospirae bacterium CG02_land_8_20_14_3_00_44_33]PIV65358.1 MAG: signal peptidase I [Nitrospirae bacterium CG01_land_8_20_14_3_00_44_22]PIW89248.1 MAG: signal peptidase I [Nitrospirae bacterium CG_4_8_14_3_um_filter_44_28]PIX89600.1 MAG: signal p
MTNRKKIIWEYAKAIITALVLAMLIRTFIIQAFKIPSGSMIPTLLVGDHILVNKFLYGTKIPFSDKKVLIFKKPERGDIMVFKYPENPSKDFIKRVVAVEGDVIESKNKEIYVNGSRVKEPYTQHTDSSMRPMGIEPRDNFGPVIVPKNKYFVMGDNRDQSYDSRYWGYVDSKDIRGKALILYWSWDAEKSWVRFGRIGSLIH